MNISSAQLRRAANIKEKIDALEKELEAVLELPAQAESGPATAGPRQKRKVSAAARAKMRKAQQARWARQRGELTNGAPVVAAPAGKRKMSPAARARLSAIAKARWRSAKSKGKTAL